MTRAIKVTLWMILMGVAAACQQPAVKQNFSVPRYDNIPKIPVNAANIEIKHHEMDRMRNGAANQMLPVELPVALRQWIKDRVEPVGSEGTIVFHIRKAGVTEQRLKKNTGIKGAFTKDLEAKYHSEILVDVERINSGAIKEPRGDASASLTRSVYEDTPAHERKQFLYDLMLDSMTMFDRNMDAQLRQWFGF